MADDAPPTEPPAEEPPAEEPAAAPEAPAPEEPAAEGGGEPEAPAEGAAPAEGEAPAEETPAEGATEGAEGGEGGGEEGAAEGAEPAGGEAAEGGGEGEGEGEGAGDIEYDDGGEHGVDPGEFDQDQDMSVFGMRPVSSVSGQGAIEIEGFDDDFAEDAFMAEEARETYEEEEEEEEEYADEDDEVDLEALIADAEDERKELIGVNQALQKKLYTIFSNRKSTEVRDTQGKLQAEGQETRYHQALQQWSEQLEERERVQKHYETQTFDMQARLEERMTRANDIRNAFHTFKLEVARSSENSRTGKPIPERIIQERMGQELKKEQEVERVRLKNITLRNQMKKLEAHLKAKEELAEGLHLIDFEQLKIENQSLNEKIEERNEELLKLRKKTTTTVQVLTHLKEKLQFVQKENEVLRGDLEELDSQLAGKRDGLNKEKLERDINRAENTRIKASSGIITNPVLLEDIEIQKEKREILQEKVEGLKLRHAQLLANIQRMQGQIAQQGTQGSAFMGSM
uniref:CCDC113/CCDC96 coiled-coil domain-containing protein n=1 Tax=Pyramimonas obovata TaxID=1411642 RepID=A0A7S0N630_9CHLO|mmetsp:Transcript_20442/g.44736  ORF Transcript_20442/g.44736 Transcript_20442/m.44736 type:complete len:514 (+) Transcript_20442:333-1874(+)